MRIYGVVGWKNTGKTGLMERLVTEFTGRGLRVATLKHAHHGVDVDRPGTDSYRHRAAGAQEVLLASSRRWALMGEVAEGPEPSLDELLARLSPADLVLIEGYKRAAHPKIEAYRAGTDDVPLAMSDPTIRAVASDARPPGLAVPLFDPHDTGGLADFILREVGA